MSTTEVRTKFSPSPTGYLYIGGARTAFLNGLFARRHKGDSYYGLKILRPFHDRVCTGGAYGPDRNYCDPGLLKVMEVLGKEGVVHRPNNAIGYVGQKEIMV